MLRGKHKPQFEAHRHEHGDFVVVVNADKLVFTGKKWAQKLYRHHTGYPGGLKERTAKEMQRRKPGEVLRRALIMTDRHRCRLLYALDIQYQLIDRCYNRTMKRCIGIHAGRLGMPSRPA